MEHNSKNRPTERGRSTVSRERPRTPAARPRDSRPRTGNAADQAAARKTRTETEGQSRVRERRETPADAPSRASSRTSSEPRRRDAPEKPAQSRSAPKKRSEPRRRDAPKKPAYSQPAPKQPTRRRTASSGRSGKKPHRVYNTNFGFKFIIMLAVVAVIVLSMIIFFKVKHINVVLPDNENGTGSYYTAEEIIAASGINLDDNLLSLSKATVASRIQAALPYVNEIQIKKQLPGTVIISFSEFDVTYGIADETGAWWLMSREGRILEPVNERDARTHLTVTGMPIQVPEVGDSFKPAATQGADMSEIAAKQKVVLEVIPALEKTEFVKQIVSVDVSTSYDLTLWYGTRYEIRLGTTEKLTYKLQYLQAVLNDKEIQRRSGTIDLTFNEDDKVHFLEFQ